MHAPDPLPPLHRPTPNRWRRGIRACAALLAALAAACTDSLVAPTHAPEVPREPARTFVSPVGNAPMSSAALYIPPSNGTLWGEVPWTALPADFGDAGWVEIRTSGQVSWTVNEATYGVDSRYCYGSNAYPYFGEGSIGGAGDASGNLRVTALVASASPPPGDYGALMLPRAGGQRYRLSAVSPGARLYAKRTGLPGVCNGSPWYNFTGEHIIEVVRVTPVQVEPSKTEFLPGEVLTWTTMLYDGVTKLLWTFERANGEVKYPSCSSSTCAYAPPGPGVMKVSAVWELAAPTVPVHAYSVPVTIRQPKLQVKCAPARIPQGNETRCVASVDLPSPFVVTSWSYSGPVTPAASAGDVKEWKFVPGDVGTGTVTVTAQVGSGVQTATAQLDVICTFFKDPTQDPLLDDADVQDLLHRLWRESNADGPANLKKERGAYILDHAGARSGLDYTGAATRCSVDPGTVTVNFAQIAGTVHTHPDLSGPVPTDGTCHGITGGAARFRDGPSSDRDRAQSEDFNNTLQRQIPGYVVDARHVHRYGRGFAANTFDRNRSCTR